MATIARKSTQFIAGMLRAETGLPQSVAFLAAASEVAVPELTNLPILVSNVSAELAEKTSGLKYPAFQIFCERITNSLREKFRTFSGTAEMVIEVRVSHDRLESVDEQMQLYIDAVTDVLDRNRGDWGNGMFYTGGYEIVPGPIKHGGRNFLQIAKVRFQLIISMD